MQSNNSKRASIILGGFMIFVLLMGAVVPMFRNQTASTSNAQPTPVPTATFPAPIANLQTVAFDKLYLHPSGLFAVAQPTGWEPSGPVTEANRAAITMVNNDQLSIIEVSVERSEPPITSLDELDARFDSNYLEASWANYGDWSEAARRVENEKLLIDFNLSLNRQTYVARQLSWYDADGWIYNVRVVAPSNATDELVYILSGLVESVRPFKQFAGTPFEWTSFYDQLAHHVIRYPAAWSLTDSVFGGPTSITGTNGEALRLDTEGGTNVADEDAASAWLMAQRPSATVLSVQSVERSEASGFAVAYSFRTVDGEPYSGLAVLLNAADESLHSANLSFPGADIDLNAGGAPAEATPEATVDPLAPVEPDADAIYAEMMSTFTILPALPLAQAAPTPTPLPAPVQETTPEAEATEAATESAEADATDAADEATEAQAAEDATESATEAATDAA